MTEMVNGSKVIIIGIDGLDAGLLRRFQDSLPNFSKLMKRSSISQMTSVFPPDSPTAWASIFTGLNPAKHGIISFKDPRSRAKIGAYLDNVQNIRERTFWDVAGKHGKKCCVIFPHMAFPPWPVNGVMVSRTTEVDIKTFDLKTYPSDFPLNCDPADLKPITSFPTNIGNVIQPTRRLIVNEAQFGKRLFEKMDWDVFFIYFSSIDNIQHIFWMAFDESHPAYPELSQYRKVIPDFYKFYDEHVIGEFLRSAPSDAAFVVLSDHGHGLRPFNLVNVNAVLAKHGYLKTHIKSASQLNASNLQDLAKKKVTNLINEKRIVAKFVSRFLSMFPRSLELYTGASPIDWSQTDAYLSDSSAGLKAYSYAGIRIRKDFEPEKYDSLCQSVIGLLLDIRDPSSKKIVEWAIKRNELYQGPFLSKYPDILFKLEDNWGVGWDTSGQAYSTSKSFKLFSGSHKQSTAVFLLDHPRGRNANVRGMGLMDIAPTVLDLLGVPKTDISGCFDGKSILKDEPS